MHPINKALSRFGIKLIRVNDGPMKGQSKEKVLSEAFIDAEKEKNYLESFDYYYEITKKNTRGFKVIKDPVYYGGEHPTTHIDRICEFTALHLHREKPKKILDIGAWRLFTIGLLAHYDVTTVDIRPIKKHLKNETVLICDAKEICEPSDSYDAVICIGGFYSFGLGRYGDEFDLNADIKSFNEIIRVLKPGGIVIFLGSITQGEPLVFFNRCRIYNYEMLQNFCRSLKLVDERFLSRKLKDFCSFNEIATPSIEDGYDGYLGCWRKEQA